MPTTDEILSQTWQIHQQGNATHAEKVYRSIAKDYGKFQNKFGLCGSPVQTDNHVIILVDDEGPSYLVGTGPT